MGSAFAGTESADPASLARGVMAVGFSGTGAAGAPLAALRAFSPGAIVLFGRNVTDRAALPGLIAALRELDEVPPLIAIDQEGGRVARLRDGVAQVPSAMAVGATADPLLAHELATLLGRDLARLGISVNLAPVADLASPEGNALGTRAYGDEPGRVVAFAGQVARGLARGGVAPTLKHFPGHGATADDSHLTLPRVGATEAELRGRDLVPFVTLIAERAAPLVMTAHVVVAAFDPARPATLSPVLLEGLLRRELGFDGVIVTDCLEMDAIASSVGTVQGALDALAAGADLLLISHRLELAHAAAAAIASAVRAGTIPISRLQQAHARVLRLRARYADLQPFAGALSEDLPLAAARRAVTVVRGEIRLRAAAPVTVISFEQPVDEPVRASGAGIAAAGDGSLCSSLRRRGYKSEQMRVATEPDDDDVALLVDHVRRLGNREFVIVTRDAYCRDAQQRAVERLLQAAPGAVVICAAQPLDAQLWPAAQRLACTYGDEPLAFEGCADVLTGRAAARGQLPLRPVENRAVR